MTARDRAVGDVMPRQVTPIPKATKAKKAAKKPIERCEVRVDGCWGRATQRHHILRRSQGGPDDAANLLGVCAPCHTWVHNNVAAAKVAGWLA